MQNAQLATDRSKAVVLCNSCFMLFDVSVSGRISYYIVGYLLAHLSRRRGFKYIQASDVHPFIRRSSVRQHLIGCQRNINSLLLKNHKYVESETLYTCSMHSKWFSCAFYCRATADILTKFLQQCFLILIAVVISCQ